MAATTIARKVGKGRRGKKAALLGAAAATAAVMTVGATATPMLPSANALTFDATTTGTLLRIVAALGVDSIDIPDVPVLGTITINLDWTDSDPVNLNDAVNSAAFGPYLLFTATRPYIFASGGTGPLLLASGQGTVGAVQAYKALLASAQGNTVPGYSPLVPAGKVNSITGQPCTGGTFCVQRTNVTNLPLALVRNPGIPNGGLYARFAPILNLFGIDPVTPEATSASSTGIKFNTAMINVALGYDAFSDFPETLNPFSLANSVLAALLPTNLLGGGELKGADTDTIIDNLIGLLTLGNSSTSYSTFAPNDLPLLEPLRLPSRIINAVLDAVGVPIHLGTPLADALQPALTILVNTGYTDVQTPSEGGTYNRTYDQSGVYTPFLSQAPLTPQEWAQVPGDVIKALIRGFKGVFIPDSAASVPASVAATLKAPAPAQAIAPAPTTKVETPVVEATSDDTTPNDVDSNDTQSNDTPSTGTTSTGGSKSPKQTKKASPAASTEDAGSQTTEHTTGGSTHKGVAGSKRSAANSASSDSAKAAS